MRLASFAWGGKFRQSADVRRMTRRRKFSIGLQLAFAGFLPLLAIAGELDFGVVHIDTHQVFQRYNGFQLATLAQTPTLNIRVNRLEDLIKRHTHPSSHHFLYFIEGVVELSVGDEKRVVGAGDFVTIPRGTAHAMHRVGDTVAVFLDVASPPDVGDVIWHE
jgi:mannose-6-phosphate isomerase-like protein (cupin superfamily)